MEIALFDPAALKGDLIKERGTEAVDDRALHLRFDGVWVNGNAAIHCTRDTFDVDFAILGDLNFGHLGHESAEHCLQCNSTARSFWRRLSPARFFCRQIENCKRAW